MCVQPQDPSEMSSYLQKGDEAVHKLEYSQMGPGHWYQKWKAEARSDKE